MPPTAKLRIVVPRFAPGVIGGAEELVRRLATALVERDWDVHVWSTTAIDEATWAGDAAPGTGTAADGVTVWRFPVVRRRRPRLFHQASRAFFRLPEGVRPERAWIRAQGPYAPALVRALAAPVDEPTLFIPYLYHPTVEGLPVSSRPRLLVPAAHRERPLHLRRVGAAIAAADALWYSSEEERALVEEMHAAARHLPHAVGTTGIEPSRGDAERWRAASGIADAVLLYGGRATPGKGLDLLFDGFAELRATHRGVRLVLTGEHGAVALPPGVAAVGRLEPSAWHDALAAALAVVVPSPMESLSLLALEAWAAGRPVIANGESDVLRGHLARSGAGLMFATPLEFSAAAARLLDDPAQAQRMGEAGRSYVTANFRWDDVVARLERLLAEARDRAR